MLIQIKRDHLHGCKCQLMIKVSFLDQKLDLFLSLYTAKKQNKTVSSFHQVSHMVHLKALWLTFILTCAVMPFAF